MSDVIKKAKELSAANKYLYVIDTMAEVDDAQLARELGHHNFYLFHTSSYEQCKQMMTIATREIPEELRDKCAFIINNVKKSCSGMPFQVENRVMNPVSFYYNFKLVGIARNRETYLATLKQIAAKKLTGCTALIGEELITITENGELVNEPKDGPVIPEDTMEYLHWKRGVV